jgi:hypothetical protein
MSTLRLDDSVEHPTPQSALPPRAMAVGVASFAAAVLIVWFFGFSVVWATAMILALLPVSIVIAQVTVREHPRWTAPPEPPARGAHLTVATIEKSLAAADRLACHDLLRRLRLVVAPERPDRAARSQLVRRMRDILMAELRESGYAAASDTDVTESRLGPTARPFLHPHDSTPVSELLVTQCLDMIEQRSQNNPSAR